jgi:O-antigen/teichoic acid export membrane protein
LRPVSAGRNTVFALLTLLTTGVFTTALTIYLLRALGPDAFGIFALALGIGAIAGLVADFGIPYSTGRFLAESRDDRAAVVSLLRDSLRLKLATAALVTGVLFAAAGPIANLYDEPGLAWPLRGIAVSLLFDSVLTLYLTAFISLGNQSVNLRLVFFESVAETASSIALVALGAGATGAAFGRATGYAVGAVLAVVVVARLFGRRSVAISRSAPGDGRTADIARYAAPLFVTNSAYTLYAQIDILLVGALLGTTAVGIFAAPLRLAVPLLYLGQAIARSVAPRQARPVRDAASVRLFVLSLRWLTIYQAALLAPVIIWAEPIVELLLGSEFGESADVLRVLAFYVFLHGLSPLVSTTVNYFGEAARRIPIVLAALALKVVLDLTLIPTIGVVGAAIGVSVAYAVYVPAHLRVCQRELGFERRPLALTLVRSLAAAAVMAAVLYAIGTDSLSLEQWLLGATGGTLAYGAVLLVTREITPGEIRRGARIVAARLA